MPHLPGDARRLTRACLCIVALLAAPKTYAAETVLYSFKGKHDGANPEAGLIAVNGNFYGTTLNGGKHGFGTVYEVTPAGVETVLHSFANDPDGANPESSLILVGDKLYGTTYAGGVYGYGAVFTITSAGKEKIIYSFKGPPDGAAPVAGLLHVKGLLYGTTFQGGTGYGTVFSITPKGEETVLYSFTGKADGSSPGGGLSLSHDDFYGTTVFGGAHNEGVVFVISATGAEAPLYAFGAGSTDGIYPECTLLPDHGNFYGTTLKGGANGAGTVFRVSAQGSETVLHAFDPAHHDGEDPPASPIRVGSAFFGTTQLGGRHNAGTLYRMAVTGREAVKFDFNTPADGLYPAGPLLAVGGTFYGVTKNGGAGKNGTVFSWTP